MDVSRKIDGLFNPAQLELLDPLIASYTALNSYEDAQREQQYALRLAETTYGKDDPRIVPALERTARLARIAGTIHDCAPDSRTGPRYRAQVRRPEQPRHDRPAARHCAHLPDGIPDWPGTSRKAASADTVTPIGGVPGPTGIPSSANGVSAASAPNPDGETALETALKIFDANPGKAPASGRRR